MSRPAPEPGDARVVAGARRTPPGGSAPGLHRWRHPAILAAAGLSVAAGFAQFGVTAALADVAAEYGEVVQTGTSIAAQAGLSATTLGIGLALIRLASLGALPLSGLADRLGRRRVVLACVTGGLALTILASLSPSYWAFVAIFALGRPLLSATNAIAGVIASEETRTADRAKAISLITAAYGTGAGSTLLLRGTLDLGFRTLFALAVVPLLLAPLAGRLLEEPDRYARLAGGEAGARVRLGSVPRELRGRLALVAGLTGSIALITGPANTLLFIYAERFLGMSPATLAAIVPFAAPLGLAGLLAGRWAADTVGRRATAAIAQAGVALAGIVTYTLGPVGAVGGYLASIFAASMFAPAAGALGAELFPTRMRATAAGWATVASVLGAVVGLVAFGLLADAFASFGPAAALVALPVTVSGAAYLLLPETRGLELEESAPDQ